MGYLKDQATKLKMDINPALDQVITYFEQNPNRKVEIATILETCLENFNFIEIDNQITKLVSRNLISEYYFDDTHVFEYQVSNDIDTDDAHREIIASLKGKGYRMTDSRKKLIQIFTSSPNSHFSFDELVKLSGEKVNIATMYNNIAILSAEKIINEFYIDDTRIFELNNNYHAHFICEQCKRVYNVDTEASTSLGAEVSKQYQFDVNTCKVEFTGTCLNCLEANLGAQNVNVINESEFEGIDEMEIKKYFQYLQARTNNNSKELTVVFLETDEVHRLNNEFRGIDRPTDVLTFVEDTEDYLGDIIVCYEYIQKQADEYGHSFKRELYFLLTHGYLHLLGYDHIEPEEEKEMFEIQHELLNKYGVSRDE